MCINIKYDIVVCLKPLLLYVIIRACIIWNCMLVLFFLSSARDLSVENFKMSKFAKSRFLGFEACTQVQVQWDPNQWDPNWIKKCRLWILLTYKYPILFCKMAYRFIYLFKKNEITKSFFKIHFLIKFGSHWFRSHWLRFRIYLRLASSS